MWHFTQVLYKSKGLEPELIHEQSFPENKLEQLLRTLSEIGYEEQDNTPSSARVFTKTYNEPMCKGLVEITIEKEDM